MGNTLKITRTNLEISDDYAIMYVQGTKAWEQDDTKVSFYYGYEETENSDEDGEWMFVAKQNGKILKAYTTTQLEFHATNNLRNMTDYLLIGINMYLNGL